MPSKKPSKLAVVVNQKPPEHKFVVPGLGKFPRSVKATAYLPMPFPGQFHLALTGNPKLPEPAPESFTEPWRDWWLSVSESFSEGGRIKCSEFFESHGLRALTKLTHRGCDPNFVMSLFSTYLWDKRNAEREQSDPSIKWHQETLRGIQSTRDFVRRHTWEKTPETQFLEKALEGMEEIARSYLDNFDFQTGRGLQNDKQNRVIYAIHHHLKKTTRGPQWRLALDLFVAADAILIDSTKRATGLNSPGDGAQRRIEPRLRSFEKGHSKEAAMIPDWVSTWPSNYSVPMIFRRF